MLFIALIVIVAGLYQLFLILQFIFKRAYVNKRFPIVDPIALISDDGYWTLTIPATSRLIHLKSIDGEIKVGFEYNTTVCRYELNDEWIAHGINRLLWVYYPSNGMQHVSFKIHPALRKQLNRHFSPTTKLP